MRLFFLFLTGISFLLAEEGELEKIRNSLVEFERVRIIDFFFLNEQDDFLKTKNLEKNKNLEKILKENPQFSTNDNGILYFNSYWEYKKDLAELKIIDNAIKEAEKKISTEEKNYLKTYLNLLKANIWLLFKKKQERPFDRSVFLLLEEIPPPLPKNKSTLNEEYLAEYYDFYGEVNSILAKIKYNFIINPFKRNAHTSEAELFFFKTINLKKNKNEYNRGFLLYILNGLFFRRNDYFFTYKVIKQLKSVIKTTEDKEGLFVFYIILANIYYEKNDLAQSWRYIQLAKKTNNGNNIVALLEKNFITRKPNLINL